MNSSSSPSSTAWTLPRLVAGALVLDELVRRERVRADLTAERDVALLARERVELRLPLLALPFGEPRREDLHRARLVLGLRPLVLHDTTMPVGRCVMRTAESVTLTCWPPAPDDRYVSMRRSLGSISGSSASSSAGTASNDANAVWRRAFASNGEMRMRRWTPRSLASKPYA